jgi:hypothetical protein
VHEQFLFDGGAGQGRGGVSAGGPGPELAGVEYCPDAGDLAACGLERVHRYGDVVVPGDQAGLAVDGAFQEPDIAGRCAGEIGQEAGDLLAAFDGAQRGAAVTGQRGGGVEQADEGADVLGFPGLLEVPDDGGLAGGGAAGGWQARTRRRAADASCRQAGGVRPVIAAISVKG